jgi:AraC-like DNA-binding protein
MWGYKMMYIDTHWFQRIQSDILNTSTGEFIPLTKNHLSHPSIFNRFKTLFSLLLNSNEDQLLLEQTILTFFTDIFLLDQTNKLPQKKIDHHALMIARDFIADQCEKDIKIDDIARATGLSRSHLIREFRNKYGMTPHAYQLAKRIDKAKELLRYGMDISTVAVNLGFTDQSHFHRNFKRIVAATPKQYKDSF